MSGFLDPNCTTFNLHFWHFGKNILTTTVEKINSIKKQSGIQIQPNKKSPKLHDGSHFYLVLNFLSILVLGGRDPYSGHIRY